MARKKKSVGQPAGLEFVAQTPDPAEVKPKVSRKRTPAASRQKKAATAPARPRTRRPKAAAGTVPLPPDASPAFPEAVSLREQIALLAYSYWEARGRREGSPEEDWLRAEREVLSQWAGNSSD